jgi:4-hydroxybenzoate polyprenyltransferase
VTGRAQGAARAAALVQAAHAGPTVAVTAFALAWGALGAGLTGGTLALLGAAVLAGQLCIGWTNDWADAGRDTVAGRQDKPVAAGQVGRRTVGAAALLAGLACVVLSLALGVVPGLVHLVAVASGLSYDLLLKSGPASPLPYAVSFGLLPAVATLAGDPPAWPPVPVVVAAALLGVAAHLANTVGDADDDARTGVRGLPQRLGPRASAVLAGLVVALAALVLLPVALAGPRPVVSGALLGAGVLLGCAAAARVLVAARSGTSGGGVARPVGRAAFWLVVGSAGVVVLGFLSA